MAHMNSQLPKAIADTMPNNSAKTIAYLKENWVFLQCCS